MSRLKDAVEQKLGVATGNPGVFTFSVGYGLGLSLSDDKQVPNASPPSMHLYSPTAGLHFPSFPSPWSRLTLGLALAFMVETMGLL